MATPLTWTGALEQDWMKTEPRRNLPLAEYVLYSRNEYSERVYTVCELSIGGCLITGMHFVVLFPPEKL